MIRIDNRRGHNERARRVMVKPDDIVMQRALVVLQRKRIAAAPINGLLSDRALTIERVGGDDGALQC